MIRNLKILGLLAVAALAVSAMAASAAQAQLGKLTTGATPNTHTATALVGEQEGLTNYFEAFGTKIICENTGVSFGATSTGTDTDITATASYKDCEAPALNRPVTVNMTSCFYTFTQPSTDANSKMTGLVDLKCTTAGDFVDVTIFTRNPAGEPKKNTEHVNPVFGNIRVFPKNNLAHVIYTPGVKGGLDDLTLDATVSGIEVTAKGTLTGGLDLTEVGGVYESTVTLFSATDDVWISE